MRCFIVYVFLLCLTTTFAGVFLTPWCSLAVTSGYRERKSTSRTVEFNEFGSLPQLEYVYRAIDKAVTIVALRTANATIVSFLGMKPTAFQQPIGPQLLNNLMNPNQHLLITGLSGDARLVTRYARQIVLNHTVAFETAPSGTYIANEIGSFLQEQTVRGGIRPLAVHCFVIDGLIEHSLHEIDAAGNVAQVWAGIAGEMRKKGREILSPRLNGSAISTIDVAQELATAVLQVVVDNKARLEEEEKEEEDEGHASVTGSSSIDGNKTISNSGSNTTAVHTIITNDTTANNSTKYNNPDIVHIVLYDKL